MSHPFEEYHDDANIGCLMWRIYLRYRLVLDSQDGSQIYDLEKKLTSDRKELAELIATYEKEAP